MFPRALKPPPGPVCVIDAGLIEQAMEQSRQSPRGRVILPFHRSDQENFHRMLNALQPGTYIQPHRHLTPPKPESIIVLKGAIGIVTFDAGGQVTEQVALAAGGDRVGIDLHAGVYHTLVALAPDTVLFEVKPGPYDARTDKDFAAWAPAEGSPEAPAYLAALAAGFQPTDTFACVTVLPQTRD